MMMILNMMIIVILTMMMMITSLQENERLIKSLTTFHDNDFHVNDFDNDDDIRVTGKEEVGEVRRAGPGVEVTNWGYRVTDTGGHTLLAHDQR